MVAQKRLDLLGGAVLTLSRLVVSCGLQVFVGQIISPAMPSGPHREGAGGHEGFGAMVGQIISLPCLQVRIAKVQAAKKYQGHGRANYFPFRIDRYAFREECRCAPRLLCPPIC